MDAIATAAPAPPSHAQRIEQLEDYIRRQNDQLDYLLEMLSVVAIQTGIMPDGICWPPPELKQAPMGQIQHPA